MSDNDINKSIINFINNNYANNNKNNVNLIIESEINDILDNINDNPCSYKYITINTQTILGISTNVNKSIIDLTYLIPNLFRKCYLQKNINLPYVCPKYTDGNTIINYFPYLLEEDLIKSFLYFNFPASYINKSNIPNNISIIKNLEKLVKKRIKTVGQSITPNQIINNLYSQNSMLLQLINFQNYINASNYSLNVTKNISSFKIKWDITISCFSYTNDINNSYIVINNTNDPNDKYSTIDPYTANNIYDIKLSFVNMFFNNNTVNDNNIIILYYQNIYTILNYVLDVYNDIILEIQSYQEGTQYCKKPYMNNTNIPILLKLYNIFYNNQIKSIEMKPPSQSAESVIPIKISIEQYTQLFINIMNTTYGTSITYLKSVILSDKDAFVFYLNGSLTQPTITGDSYNYFYINIYNPSVITLNDYLKKIPLFDGVYYMPAIVAKFVIDFNIGITIPLVGRWNGYISVNNVSYTTFIKYPLSGLYPNCGVSSSACDGYLYYYYDSNSKLISIIFLSLRYFIDNNGPVSYGFALEIYHR
jgi:hypothetical protein